ncbi:hypothetical protein ACJ72_03251 [Emergomyces africanus]|uniref:Uncharacterized protein n=1 Tax=Emergomyces africanus TaxID=1955775 RepID=A0A1B7P057_9EURO|nr:hypothetical protein ACJ72_03251 [Emergomyces africanus]
MREITNRVKNKYTSPGSISSAHADVVPLAPAVSQVKQRNMSARTRLAIIKSATVAHGMNSTSVYSAESLRNVIVNTTTDSTKLTILKSGNAYYAELEQGWPTSGICQSVDHKAWSKKLAEQPS